MLRILAALLLVFGLAFGAAGCGEKSEEEKAREKAGRYEKEGEEKAKEGEEKAGELKKEGEEKADDLLKTGGP